jgi:hypothetical protein
LAGKRKRAQRSQARSPKIQHFKRSFKSSCQPVPDSIETVDREKHPAKEHSVSKKTHRLCYEMTALQRERDHSGKNVLKSSIFNYAWHLQKNGRAKSTIHTVIDRLKRRSKYATYRTLKN